MGYDISIMRIDGSGRVDYAFPGISGRCVGSNKLIQHFVKHLYDDNIGGLIKLIRKTHDWTESDIRMCILNTSRHIERLQLGKYLHPEEKFVSVRVDKIEIQKSDNTVNIEFTIKTQAGQIPVVI